MSDKELLLEMLDKLRNVIEGEDWAGVEFLSFKLRQKALQVREKSANEMREE